jgi:hypothetical protein
MQRVHLCCGACWACDEGIPFLCGGLSSIGGQSRAGWSLWLCFRCCNQLIAAPRGSTSHKQSSAWWCCRKLGGFWECAVAQCMINQLLDKRHSCYHASDCLYQWALVVLVLVVCLHSSTCTQQWQHTAYVLVAGVHCGRWVQRVRSPQGRIQHKVLPIEEAYGVFWVDVITVSRNLSTVDLMDEV